MAPTSAKARVAATTSDGIISFNVRFNDKKETKICLRGVIGEYSNGVLTITGFTDNNPLNEQWKGQYYPTFNKNNPDIFQNFYKKNHYDNSIPCQQVICSVEKEGETPQNMCREAILPNSFYHDNCDITPKIYVSARLINLVNKIKEQNPETKTENGRTLKIFASDYRMSSADLQKIADECKNLPNDHLAIWLHELENGNVKYEVFTGPNVVFDAEREKIIDAWLLALDPYIPDMPFNPFYAVLNGVSEMAKQHLTFPKKYWDCEDKDYTQLPWVSDASDCVDECITTEDWAFLCGVWDGVITEASGIVDFFAILSDGQKRSELKQSIINLKNNETWAAMWQNLKTQHTDASGCQLSHQIGKDVVAVGTLALPITKLSRAKMIATAGNLADNVVLTLARFKVAGRVGFEVLSSAGKGTFELAKDAFDVTKLVVNAADYCVTGTARNFFGKNLELATDAGGYMMRAGDGEILRATELMRDANSILLKMEKTIAGKKEEILALVRRTPRLTLQELEDLYENIKNSPPSEFIAGTDEHMAQRWAQYKERGGDYSYDTWANIYDANMVKARLANAKVAKYFDDIAFNCPAGKTCKEVTQNVVVNGENRVRRLDIANKDAIPPHGIEVKAYETEKVYKTQDIVREIEADAFLVQQGWRIEWKFIDCELSQPLRDALTQAGITIL